LERAIEDRIAKGKKPKAILCVYLYGMPGKIEELLAVANKYEIPLIEDAAEALGSKYKGKSMGTFGKFGILSFNGNKIITTSGGGALISDDQELIEKSRFLATQARDNAPHYQHSHVGYNYRMSNIVAGIGRGQMEVLDERVAQRRANFVFYKELFADIDGITLLEEPNEDYFSNYWLTSILVDPSKTNGITREDIRLELEKENIECRPLWKPMHMQPVFEDCPFYGDGTSEKLFEDGLCLPSGSNMTSEEKLRIKNAIFTIFSKK
jgi:dTDP-4-amino-4,6-dideoxygalactose transaminase